MQKDSLRLAGSGTMTQNQTDPQESPVKAFHCGHCVLIFKSRTYLFDHLTQVHGCDVDTALKDTGLKYSGSVYSCPSCDFTDHDWNVLTEHRKNCSKTSENRSLKGNISMKKGTIKSTKDLKIYKKPSQTITKYFAPSGSNVISSVKYSSTPVDNSEGTLVLEDSPSDSKPNTSGVFKVTAKSIDITTRSVSDRFLLKDDLVNADPTSPKPVEQTAPHNAGKRTCKKSPKSSPSKKAKMEEEEMKLPGATSKKDSLSSADFSFEVSEDEEEMKINLVNGDAKVYSCKHCDYNDVDIKRMSAHYQNNHPYIRYNKYYIQEPSDYSATFRCLECPVEFSYVADLRRHYTKDHPEAQNVFTMKTCEFSLVFKCFVCPFTSNTLKTLKQHYKAMHPRHKVENPLMFCRYSATRHQEESPQLKSLEKVSSPEKSEGISPERTPTPGKEDETAPSPQHPTSKGADVVMYECNNCAFSHKSVVVLQVHYKKSHPEEKITLDKINQSVCVTSTTPSGQLRPVDTVTIKEKCTPPEDISDSSKEPKTKAQFTRQRTSLSLVNPKHSPAASKVNTDSPKTKKVEAAEDQTKVRKSLPNTSTGMDVVSSSSRNMTFYCTVCSYSNTQIKSVVYHHNSKHTGHTVITMLDILNHSVELQGNKHQSEPEAHCEKELHCEEAVGAGTTVTKSNRHACALDLFYCQKCNYGNPTVQGILNHQIKIHLNIQASSECVIAHTALMRDEIKKCKNPSFSSGLPLPIIKEGAMDLLFCHFCNYRHKTMVRVMQHYFKMHRGSKITSNQIRLHSSVVLEKVQKANLNAAANHQVNHAQVGKKGYQKRTSKKPLKSFSVSTSLSQTKRTLKCQNCAYTTPHLYLLRRHLQKIHKATYSVRDVLKLCCKQGILQPGYHCDMCVFSSKEAATLHKHRREKHARHNISLEYITTQLYVDPEMCSPKKKKPKSKQAEGVGDSDNLDSSSPSQMSGPKDAKTYSCRACSFKGSSVSSITHHYRAVHPWSVKEDGSVLDVISSKEQSANMQEEDGNEYTEFESYQVPLEFDNLPGSSDERTGSFKCSICTASFHSQHGLTIHCGIKHPSTSPEKVKEQHVQKNTRVHVFKCPHCPYVNTNYQGVLIHTNKRHPTLEHKANSLYVDNVHLHNLDNNAPVDKLKFCGYMCKKCPQIFALQETLNQHYEKDHKRMPLKLKLAPKSSVVTERQPSHGTQDSVSKAGADVLDSEYKCVLCPCSFITETRLGIHYTKKHGKETFLKYYVPLYHQKPTPSSPDCLQTQESENTSEASSTMDKGGKKSVYRCPCCSYVNASHYGVLTHIQMKHPGTVARADKLRKVEILIANMVRCKLGKGANERGYRCRKCPQIHASVKKLKIHCEREHKHGVPATSEHSAETEPLPLSKDHDSVLGSASLKNKKSSLGKSSSFMYRCSSCTYSTLIRKQLGTHYTQRHGKSAFLKHFAPLYFHIQKMSNLVHENPENAPETITPALQDTLYKCHICSYKGMYRRYLHSHYRKKHKLDLLTTCQLLEKYNTYRSKKPKAESQNSVQVECKKCPNLFFDSSELLIAHYCTFHRSEYKVDFTVLAERSHRSTGIYKCDRCNKKIHGITNLRCHLDRHRAHLKRKANAVKMKAAMDFTTAPEAPSVEFTRQDALPTLETVEEFVQRNMKTVETSALPTSPPSSSSTPTDLEQPELESSDDKTTCKQCKRSFMSVKGLRSHERSHAALAAIQKLDNLSTSAARHKIEKYLLYKSGTQRPFICSICSFRTTVMGLWKSHLIKKHEDIILAPAETVTQDEENTQRDPLNVLEEINSPEGDEETEDVLYSEPPDVQRQLNHYNLMARAGSSSNANVQETQLTAISLLNCELCNFNSGHLSSMRRHYLNRHGKKIIRCKDCNFFTGLRKNLEMHMETGHSTFQSEPTHQKDLRCPFCLYQSKNKNSMIDHIVLHREERVMPIEVRRPKLSRYLQGIVFRCHKCTFTSASAENLRLHMMRHDDIKPFKCRLCYFDCTRLSDLEAHLCDKHQVMRNHELVGQISLDQLSTQASRMPEEEEEEEEEAPFCNLEHHSNKSENREMETEFFTGYNDVPRETQSGTETDNTVQYEHSYYKKVLDKESHSESCALQLQCENDAKQTTTVEEMHERNLREKAGIKAITHTKKEQGIQNVVDERSKVKTEDLSDSKNDGQMDENQAQPKLRGGEDGRVQQKEEAAAESSSNYDEMDEKETKIHIRTLPDRTQNIEAKIEDDILRDILLLDEDGSGCKGNKKLVKFLKTEVVDNDLNPNPHLDEASVTVTQNLRNDIRAQQSFIVNKSLLILPSCVQLKISHYMQQNKGSSGVSVTNRNEQAHNQTKSEEVTDPYGEMPVLENEYLKEEMPHLEHFHMVDHSDRVEKMKDGDGIQSEDAANQCTDRENRGNQSVPEGELTDTEGNAIALCPQPTEEKLFTCELCGRSLDNGSELERHILRHGL